MRRESDSIASADLSEAPLNPTAATELLPLVYEELRRIAHRQMSRERLDHTLQPTALVHEAYLRLVGANSESMWESRGHFFAAAAEAMRRILVERARRRRSKKHGGGLRRVNLDALTIDVEADAGSLLALDEALVKFSARHADKAQLVALRYFAGA